MCMSSVINSLLTDMPGVMRLNVDTAGGIAFQTSNTSVTANGQLIMRLGDLVAPHGSVSPHDQPNPMVTASSTVTAAGITLCRLGDLAACNHAATGSSTVFAS